MALVIADRVRETTTTSGTGTVTLGGAYAGFQSFSVIGDGNTTYYAIVDSTTGAWEVGIGTYTASGTTLSRDTVLSSSNSGSLVNFAANTKDVIVTQPSERAVYVVGSNVVAENSATIPNSLLANSTISGVSLGSNLNALTIGTGLSGTSYNGSTGVTVAIDSTVATLTGSQTLTNKTLTSPRIGTSILDTNGNELLALTATASAVNDFTIVNAAAGANPQIQASGSDTNISINLVPKGTGTVQANGVPVVTTTGTQTLTNKTVESLVLNNGYTEEVFTISDGGTVNLDPNNGSIQLWTLGASRTPGQANWAAGQSIILMVDDGTARTITWTTLAVVWETDGGNAPTLATSGYTVIVLWKVSTTIYGARVGNA
jgi:hypothetical protein